MANPFEKFGFEKPQPAGGNPFDRFEKPQPKFGTGELVDTIPGMGKEVVRPPLAPRGIGERMYGAGEAGLSLATGVPAALAGAYAGVGGRLMGKDQNDTARSVMGAMTYRPRSEAGQDYLGNVGKALDESKLAGLGPTEGVALGAIPMPGRAVRGAAGRAIAESPEATLVKKGAAALAPKVDPQTAQLAQRAEQMGIKIPPDMLSDNKFLRLIGQASREVPASGSPVPANREAFNRALIRSFGGDESATKITPQVFDKAMDQHGKTIGDISAAHDVFPASLEPRLQRLMWEVRNETPEVRAVIDGYLKDIGESVAGGTIAGEAWRKLRTEVTGQMRRSSNSDLQHALSQLDDMMLDVIEERLTPQESQAFNQARRYYANAKTLAPLIGNAAAKGLGDMSPAALAARVSSGSSAENVARGRGGDLADISAVGSRFMTEPGSSNTAERRLAYSALGGGGLVGGIPAAAGLYGLANAYNRLGPWFSRRMTGGQIPQPPR
jgi:hypothetical protein